VSTGGTDAYSDSGVLRWIGGCPHWFVLIRVEDMSGVHHHSSSFNLARSFTDIRV
jgi:hypothetical protein